MGYVGLMILLIIITIASIFGVIISCSKLIKALNGEESDDESKTNEKNFLLYNN